MTPGADELVVAVPGLAVYRPDNGIGRVFQSLAAHWDARVRLVEAKLDTIDLPVARNFPYGVRAPGGTDLLLLPMLTGAQALRDTRGVPSVVVVHDVGVMDFPGDREEMNWLTHQTISRSFSGLRHASGIIAVSRFTRERLLHYLPELEPRVVTIHNGISPVFLTIARSRAESRQRLAAMTGVNLAQPVLVNVGTEIVRKNMPLFLQVLRRIKSVHPRAQLLKVGRPGSLRARARTIATARELGLEIGKDILFLDRADDETIADAYRAADVFVSTSLYEGFGLPALEAMAAGTPVVVTDRGAFPEVVGEAGRVVAPVPEPFSRAVLAALADRDLAARAQSGRERAASFSWAATADLYLEAMHKIATRRTGADGSWAGPNATGTFEDRPPILEEVPDH